MLSFPSAASTASPTLGARLRAEWKLKLVGIPGFIAIFFTAYFLLLRFPLFPTTTIPFTDWDRLISFQPWSLGLYFSLWFYVSLEPALLDQRSELLAYLKSVAALAGAGLACFFFWPTATGVPPDIVWAEHPGFAFLKEVDRSNNACPSLHVAFAVFAAGRWPRLLRAMRAGGMFQAASLLWCVGIVYSTLATRQHVLIDVWAGAALGGLAAFISTRRLRTSRVVTT